MTDIVIKAEKLSKKYTIGHQAENSQCKLCTNVPLYVPLYGDGLSESQIEYMVKVLKQKVKG